MISTRLSSWVSQLDPGEFKFVGCVFSSSPFFPQLACRQAISVPAALNIHDELGQFFFLISTPNAVLRTNVNVNVNGNVNVHPVCPNGQPVSGTGKKL